MRKSVNSGSPRLPPDVTGADIDAHFGAPSAHVEQLTAVVALEMTSETEAVPADVFDEVVTQENVEGDDWAAEVPMSVEVHGEVTDSELLRAAEDALPTSDDRIEWLDVVDGDIA